MRENLSIQLQSGINQLGLVVSENTQQKLFEFLFFLQKWNSAYNLTAIRSLDQMLTHHILDSLSIAPYVEGKRILDVGTGAGFPGIPLAFYYPNKQFVLLDSNGKKVRFLIQAQMTFKIKNIEPVQERVEKLLASTNFDVIICRAVGEMSTIMQASKRLLNKNGHWIFMKGAYPQDELQKIVEPHQVRELMVPGIDALRHVVLIDNL